ncbi:MAG TPA: SAF domain-containing protein [Streptosporangiaceae bacterium]|jgi:pilus assembly protein CpaB
MNPRQRRGVLLMVLAAIGAVAVFIAVIGYVNKMESEIGATTTVLQLTADAEQYHPVSSSQVRAVQMPTKYVSSQQVTDFSKIAGLVPATNLKAGSFVQSDMFTTAPGLKPGQREVVLNASSGLNLDIGSKVDLIAIWQGSQQGGPACAERLLTNQPILSIDAAPQQNGKASGGVSVHFAVTGAQALHLDMVQAAANFNLNLVAPGQDVPQVIKAWCQGDKAGRKDYKE